MMMISPKDLFSDSTNWRVLGWVILCIRFVQGWIFWGGGSRRFIYAPQKLDPDATQWMANKVQSAMSGALFDTEPLVSFLLHHFVLLYAAIIIFSLMELLSGLGLIFGFFTRAAAMLTVLFSVIMMILFGWQGTTCMDEWTMAVSNLSMALTLVLTGSTVYSVDAWLMRRYPGIVKKSWFLLLGSAPWSFETIRRVTVAFFLFTMLYTLGTYNYYRGAIFSRYHAGPVSAKVYHLTLTQGRLQPNGSVSFKMNVDAGPIAAPMYIVRIELQDASKTILESWTVSQLSTLPESSIHNSYPYNQIKAGPYGLIAPESAKAELYLSPTHQMQKLSAGSYQLKIYTVDGQRWDLGLQL